MSNKWKRCAFDLQQKIRHHQGNRIWEETNCYRCVVVQYDLARLRKDTTYESVSNNSKRMWTATFDDIEEMFTKWYTHAKSRSVPVSWPLLRDKAQEFAKLLKHFSFPVGYNVPGL